VCAGGLLMDDRWLSLFILFRLFYSKFPHVYTKNTQQRTPPPKKEKSQNVAISNHPAAAGFFLLRHIASDQLSSFPDLFPLMYTMRFDKSG
jgi:hypothetical protein